MITKEQFEELGFIEKEDIGTQIKNRVHYNYFKVDKDKAQELYQEIYDCIRFENKMYCQLLYNFNTGKLFIFDVSKSYKTLYDKIPTNIEEVEAELKRLRII